MSRRITDLSTEPVTLAEVKAFSKVETDAEDSFLTSLIKSCRHEIEDHCKLAFGEEVFEEVLDVWPVDPLDGMPLPCFSPRLPVRSAAVALLDAAGTATPTTETLVLNPSEGVLYVDDDSNAPDNGRTRCSVRIRWTVGYGDGSSGTEVLPAQLKTALLSLVDYRWLNRGVGDRAAFPVDVARLVEPYRLVNV